MGVEGIGASVVRKEDRRFITGRGRYVDDIKLVGMTYAHFIRSPHAHAKVKSIESSEAMKMPGVVGVLTGKELVDDKIGNLICGWAITSKDGSPMKMSAHPAIAHAKANHVGDAVAVVIAETLGEAKDALAPFPQLAASGPLHDAAKEYVEARLTLALAADRPLASAEELGVSDASWLNGLAEAASELRRHLLDRLRDGEFDQAEQLLAAMDDVYALLVTVDYPDALSGGLRRTTDALRPVLERTRGDLTTTFLQQRLQQALENRLPD